MVAAALPKRSVDGRQDQGNGMGNLVKRQHMGNNNPMLGRRDGALEAKPHQRWNSKAWDAYEYRANVPTLVQFDRDRSIRGKGVKRNYEEFTELFRPNLKGSNSRQRSTKPDKEAKVHKGAELQKGNGSNDGSGEPEEALKETKIPLKAVGEKVKDRAWLQRVRVSFAKKFYTASTLASKNTKRKKVTEILDGMNEAPFPLTTESITTIAAVLDATGMRAGGSIPR